MSEPKSLQEAIVYFSNPDNCIDYLAVRRWPNGKVICPTCGSEKVRSSMRTRQHLEVRQASLPSVSSPSRSEVCARIPPSVLDKWLTALWLLTNCKNGISSCELARDLNVTQKTAWFMLHRIRLALQDENFGSKLGGRGRS